MVAVNWRNIAIALIIPVSQGSKRVIAFHEKAGQSQVGGPYCEAGILAAPYKPASLPSKAWVMIVFFLV